MKQNKNYWFKEKNFGWGWTPCTWQGWLTLFVFVGLTTLSVMYLIPYIWWFLFINLSLYALFIAICYKKGPKPRWRFK